MNRRDLLAAAIFMTAAVPLDGQLLPDSVRLAAAPEVAPSLRWASYSVAPHAWNTTVAITATLPVGSADDRVGLEGTAWLLGESVGHAMEERLSTVPALVTVKVDRGQTVYTVLVARDDWGHALASLEDALFGASFGASGLDVVRNELLQAFAFEEGLPLREFEAALYDLLTDGTASWIRDPRGTAASIMTIGNSQLEELRERYARSQTTISIAGGVDPITVGRTLNPEGGGQEIPLVSGTPDVVPVGPAWRTGERRRIEREITSGWIAAAYPLAPPIDPTALDYFVQRVRSQLVTQPPPPGLFSAFVELEQLPGRHPVLLIRAAVLPDAVTSWEDRIRDTVTRAATEEHPPEFFRAYRRRFRSERLLADASPEAQSLRAARDLRWIGRVRDLPAEIRELEQADLAAVANALGEPRVLVFGPALAGGRQSRQ